MSVSSVHFRCCILMGAQTADYMKIIIQNINLLVIVSVSAMRRT